MNFSCRYCEDKHSGCHAHCDIYKAEKAEYDALKKKERASRAVDDYLNDNKYAQMDYNAKRKKKHPSKSGCIR